MKRFRPLVLAGLVAMFGAGCEPNVALLTEQVSRPVISKCEGCPQGSYVGAVSGELVPAAPDQTSGQLVVKVLENSEVVVRSFAVDIDGHRFSGKIEATVVGYVHIEIGGQEYSVVVDQ